MNRFLVLTCLTLLIIFISMTKISDYDFWWHLKLGETVYNTGQIYTADTFSYTFNGQPQFNAEWLADLLIYLSYKSGGFYGVNVLKTLVILLTFLFLYGTLKNMSKDEEAGFYASVLTLVLVLFSLRFRLFIRPYLFSFLFFSIFLFIISHFEKNRNIKLLYLLPFIQILWANMSKGAFYGPILLGIFIISFGMIKKIRFVVILFFVIACSFLSPATYKIYSLPLSVLVGSQYKETIGEHQPLSLMMLWGYGFKYTYAYQLLVLVALSYLIFLRGWRNIYHLLLFAFFWLQSLILVRMIDFFSLTAVVLTAFPVEHLVRRLFSSL
ncbi:MAG: hypothetical protein HZA17_03545, partial [Nitrospirae bacterium]|nr:hypothetical protein [Nitrospirota bacterium]